MDIYYNVTTERSVVILSREERTIISTKEKIKQIALALFSKRGYYGTSMSDIADAVGIAKASLYSHYSGKDDLFLAVTEDYMRDYKMLNDRLHEASEKMDIPDKLHYIFEEYILYYLRNPLIFYFSTQSIYFVPDELRESILPRYIKLDKCYWHRLEAIFAEGIRLGAIRQGDPAKSVWSFKIKMNGALSWMFIAQLGEESIAELWNDFWFGVAERHE